MCLCGNLQTKIKELTKNMFFDAMASNDTSKEVAVEVAITSRVAIVEANMIEFFD